MDERIRQALEHGRTIDITTTGRASGHPRRVEIWFHNLDGARVGPAGSLAQGARVACTGPPPAPP